MRATVAVSCLLLLVAAAHVSDASLYDIKSDVARYAVTRSASSRLRALLNSMKEYMKTGNDSLGIPKLDPFVTEYQDINFNKHDVSIKGNVSNVIVEGLSDYEVQAVDFKLSKWNLTIGLKWPRISGKTNYSVDAFYADKVSIYGTGDISFDLRDLEFSTQIKMKANHTSKEISVQQLSNTRVKLGSLKLKLTGIFNDDELSELVSEAVSDILPETIDEYQPEAVAIVNELLKDEANKLLENVSLDDIMKMIM